MAKTRKFLKTNKKKYSSKKTLKLKNKQKGRAYMGEGAYGVVYRPHLKISTEDYNIVVNNMDKYVPNIDIEKLNENRQDYVSKVFLANNIPQFIEDAKQNGTNIDFKNYVEGQDESLDEYMKMRVINSIDRNNIFTLEMPILTYTIARNHEQDEESQKDIIDLQTRKRQRIENSSALIIKYAGKDVINLINEKTTSRYFIDKLFSSELYEYLSKFRPMLVGLLTLNQHQLIHGDIKSENTLVNFNLDDSGNYIPSQYYKFRHHIIDFGYIKSFREFSAIYDTQKRQEGSTLKNYARINNPIHSFFNINNVLEAMSRTSNFDEFLDNNIYGFNKFEQIEDESIKLVDDPRRFKYYLQERKEILEDPCIGINIYSTNGVQLNMYETKFRLFFNELYYIFEKNRRDIEKTIYEYKKHLLNKFDTYCMGYVLLTIIYWLTDGIQDEPVPLVINALYILGLRMTSDCFVSQYCAEKAYSEYDRIIGTTELK
jgi:serine/threonine protein kinase